MELDHTKIRPKTIPDGGIFHATPLCIKTSSISLINAATNLDL
jgi:hypothetical protein